MTTLFPGIGLANSLEEVSHACLLVTLYQWYCQQDCALVHGEQVRPVVRHPNLEIIAKMIAHATNRIFFERAAQQLDGRDVDGHACTRFGQRAVTWYPGCHCNDQRRSVSDHAFFPLGPGALPVGSSRFRFARHVVRRLAGKGWRSHGDCKCQRG